MKASHLAELSCLFPTDVVSFELEECAVHGADKWLAQGLPDAVVHARSTHDVSVLMQWANERGIPVTPRGAGFGYVGGCVPEFGGVSLTLARMNQILELSQADFVAVVQPGVITGDLQRAAKELGLFYPPDPASLKDCSLGGNAATNAGGPRCLKYGVTKHYVLGLEVVLADGSVLRTGGRCHKNKTGFDLAGMFVGSEGMLGVITELTLRLLPNPQARAMISAGFEDIDAAAKAVAGVFAAGFLPAALELTDDFTLNAAREFKGVDLAPGCRAHLMTEIDGRASSVGGEIQELRRVLEGLGARHVALAETETECEAFWQLRREFSMSLKASGLTKLNEDVVVPRGRLVELFRYAREMQRETGFPVACFGHAGDGNIHTNIMVADINHPEQNKRAELALDQLFAQVLAWGGAITGEHGVGIAKRRWFRQAAGETAWRLHGVLKNALDPRGVMNPGKFLRLDQPAEGAGEERDHK